MMNNTDALNIIHQLLREAMLGASEHDPRLLLVVRAILMHVEHPARQWIVYEVAREAASNSESISRQRKALLDGTPDLTESTFDVAEDSWVGYVACEEDVKADRRVAIEILDPYAYDDCGHLIDVNVLRGRPDLADNNTPHRIIDLEIIVGNPRDAASVSRMLSRFP